jgi:hypothetical protein
MGLGVRYPLKILPWLLLQLFYNSTWLIAVALPLWSAGQTPSLTKISLIPVIVDLVVIPWSYVLATYVRIAGNRRRLTNLRPSRKTNKVFHAVETEPLLRSAGSLDL